MKYFVSHRRVSAAHTFAGEVFVSCNWIEWMKLWLPSHGSCPLMMRIGNPSGGSGTGDPIRTREAPFGEQKKVVEMYQTSIHHQIL